MKKILSLVLTLCIILMSCALLSSCSGKSVKAKDVEKDAAAVLSDVLENTGNQFFTDDAKLSDIIEKSAKGGSFSVIFESESLLGDISSINETIYMNGKDKEFVSDTVVKYDGQDLAARIFLDKTGLLFNSNAILGSDKTLALNFATLTEKFSDSVLADMLYIPEESRAEVEEMLEILKGEYEKFFSEDMAEQGLAKMNEFLALLKQSVTEAKVSTPDGEKKCVVVSYVINNETITDYINKAIDENYDTIVSANPESAETMREDIDEALKQMNETVQIDLRLDLNINKKAGVLASVVLSGDCKVTDEYTEESENYTVNASAVFGDTKIAFDLDMACGAEAVGGEFVITKSEADGVITYDAAVSAYETDEDGKTNTQTPFSLKYAYTKDTGAFTLTVTTEEQTYVFGEPVGDPVKTTIKLGGIVKVEKDSAHIEFNTVSFEDFSISFRLAFIFNKNADIPARPTDAIDVVNMTEEQFAEIMTEFSESPLGKIIADLEGEFLG